VFSLFSSRKNSAIEIVKPGKGLTKRMAALIELRQKRLDDLGDDLEEEIDIRLVKNVSAVLDPILGPEGCGDDDSWFQSMDWYGDGVRHLEFKPGRFPMAAIPQLQALLIGEYEPFSILCWAPLDGEATPEHEQGLVIFSDTILITAKLAAASTLIHPGRGADV
jgi:hypothetical protein